MLFCLICAGAKKKSTSGGIVEIVETCNVPNEQMTVEKVLTSFPQMVDAFQSLRTGCVGCRMARFCTLADVSRAYSLPLREFLDRLLALIPSNSQKENV